MNRLAEVWSGCMYAPSSGHRVAAFRILFGLFMLAYLGALLPHVTLLFSSHGVYVPYLLPDLAPPPVLARLLYAAMLLAAGALTVGYRANLAAACLLGLFLHHYFLQLAVKQSSFDRIIIIYLLVLCFADAGHVWSVDARGDARGGPRVHTRVPTVWAERLIAFQSIVLYLGAGFWKAMNPAWHGGELLFFTLQGMFATDLGFALTRLGLNEATWAALAHGIVAAELGLGLALMFRRTRPAALVAGVIFHVANCVVLAIPEFLLSVTAYAVFIETSTLQRWGAWITSAVTNRRPASAS